MAFHQIFCEEKISNGWQDRYQQDADRRFALIEQPLHQQERALEIARSHRVSQFENHAGAGERNELTHLLHRHAALAALMKIDLLEFIVDLSRIASGEQHEEIKRVVLEL